MNASAEQRDLLINPLPEVKIIIESPLTRVYELDNIIAKMEMALNSRREERQQALDYAIREQIAEDENCRLETKVKRFRTLNITRFKEVFPEEFMLACNIEHKDLESKMENVGQKLPITLVDKLVKKAALEAAPGVISVTESISHSVVRK